MKWRGAAIAGLIFCLVLPAMAHQLVGTVGYANSGTPKTGDGVPPNIITAGGGYAFGLRVDLLRKNLMFGPAFMFWNNLTGDPIPDVNSSYLQAEFGGRISYRTETVPSFYTGVGLGYTFSHCEYVPKFFGNKETYDGEFPTGSVHVGVKTASRNNGIGAIGELGYSFGLGNASGSRSIGPAHAFLVQIGVALDILSSP